MHRVLTPLKLETGIKRPGELVELSAGDAMELLALGAVEEIRETPKAPATAPQELDPEIEGAFPSLDAFKTMDRDALLIYAKEHLDGAEFKGNETQVRNQIVKAVDAKKAQLYAAKAASEGNQ